MNLLIRRLALATATTLCSIAVTGCTLGANSAPAAPIASAVGSIHGQAFGGHQPIVGAQIFVYAANTSGYGAASTLLSTTVPVTDSNGFFTITGDYTCTAGQQVYLYALGGNTGSGTNTASGMLAILGTCPASGTLADVVPYVWMNEVTTVATAYALAGFATDATHIADDETVGGNTTAALAQTGMANAFATASNLVNIATGSALTATPAVGSTGVVPQSRINTIANILVACVNTPSKTSSNCSTLFANATSDGTATGIAPTDTATAAINIAHHPTANVATLYGLVGGEPAFVPSDGSAPADFTLSIQYPQGGSGTVGLAADGNGNVFATYGGGNLVYKITPTGVVSSVAVTAPRHLAIDTSNNVWVPTTNASGTTNTITELNNSLGVVGQYNAVAPGAVSVFSLSAIGFASNGDLWAVGAKGKAIHLNSSGVALGSIAIPTATTVDIAINPSGFLGVTAGSATLSNLSIFDSTGTAIANSPFTGGGLATPQGVISDASGNFWISNNAAPDVAEFTAAGAPVSSSSGYSTTATALVTGEFDGLGNYFTGGSGTVAGISELNSSGTQIATFIPPTAANQYFAVDPSGNLWFGGVKTIGQMIGVAAPKVTPIATATFNGKLTTRP